MKRFSTVPSESTITLSTSPGRVGMKRTLSTVRVSIRGRTRIAAAAGQVREQSPGLAQQIGARRQLHQHLGDARILLLRELTHTHERVDEQAKGLFGGDAASGSVGLREIALVLQVGEHVADRGGRQVEAVLLDQSPTSHRLAGRDEVRHHRVKDGSGASGERAVTVH